MSRKINKISEKDVKEFVLERFEDVKKSMKIRDLVEFQSTNKYMIMAQNQKELKILGNTVASNKKSPFLEIPAEYENI